MSSFFLPVTALFLPIFLGATSFGDAPAKPAAQFEGKETLLRPQDYREWVFVGSSLGLRYEEGKKAPQELEYKNIYIDPAAYRAYRETGAFPQGTVLILESAAGEEKKEPGLRGSFQKEFTGLSAAVKDKDRFPDGWAYFSFSDVPGKTKAKARPAKKTACYDCHREKGAEDNVFTQFYPVLNLVKARRDARSSEGKSVILTVRRTGEDRLEPTDGRSAKAAISQPEESPGKAAPKSTRMEVHFVDVSTMKLSVVDPQIELRTRYGDLVIPMADIHQIDLGMRVTAEETKRAETLAARFASLRFRDRAEATADLEALGYKAFSVLLRSAQGSDPEVARRSEALLTKLRNSLPADVLEMPSYDTVVTEHSQMAGTIRAVSFRVRTFQFGDQVLKLADVRSLRALDTRETAADVSGVLPDPGSLQAYQQQVGKMIHFRVTGAVNGSVWGTGQYTTDSTLAVAAVHAGILKPGQTAVVRVKIIPSPPMFAASTQHGVASAGYGPYGAAFEFSKSR
jgi:hypothetical protein